MDKTTNEVSHYHSFPNQTITHSSLHPAGDKRKASVFPGDKAAPEQPSAQRSRLIEPQKVPTPDLGQRTTAACQATSHFQSDHSTARSTDQEAAYQSLSTGEFFFANTPLTQQRIIDQLRHEQSATYCIRALDDLEKHGLMQQTWLEGGQLQKAEGRLFTDEPMTLVFDLTSMTPGDIASFNDLLQVGPKCNDKPLGDRVRRVFLVNQGMLDGSQPANPDLWRRLGQMPEKVVAEADYITDSVTDETLLAQKTTEDIPANVPLITIDFATTDNWYLQLFGGINLNDRGQLVFSEGALANLKENTHLVFNNAPWDDTGFQTALATAIRVGGFTANRQWVRLPEQISLSVAHICATELNARKDQTISDSTVFCPQSPFVVINGSSIERLKGHVMIDGTTVVQTDMLANLLQGCRQLVLTGELDDKQWLWLLCQLEELPESKRPRLFANLPTDLLLPAMATGACNPHCVTFTYQINPGDTLESLQQVNLTSQNRFTFSLTNSPLLAALVNGTPTTLYGLERNKELAANLETLLLPAPYLFIHGHKIDLPKARATFMTPPGQQATGSALINALLNVSDSQPPAPENPVYSLLMSLPQSRQRHYPDRPPWTGEDFQYRFEQQCEAERLLDGSPGLLPCHQRQALHVLLAKAYRGDPKIYSFIKAKIACYYPDQPADNRADRSALERWLTHHPAPELRDIKADFWMLARHCPVTVHQGIKAPDDIDNNRVKQLAIYVVVAAHPARQRPLAQRLGVDLRRARQKRFFDGNVRSTLKDTLIAHRLSLKQDTIISQTAGTLESQIAAILMGDQTDQLKSQQIREILATAFVNDQLPVQCQDLPDALLARQRHNRSRQERRLVHLARRVREHPVVFLQGEAGAGKTFMARAIAAKAGYPACQVLQLGPNHTREALFGGQQLVSYPTGNGAVDHCTEFREGPLLQWALSDNPPLLVLDEANLVPEGLLAPLAGLTRQPPVLHYQGREYRLNEHQQHRIILTGNPDHYSGRHLDNTLKSRIPTFFYNPLPDSVLANAIILPNLPEAWPDHLKHQTCDRLLTLYNQFRELLDQTTPRDIIDVLATVRQILRHCSATGEDTPAQVNALIRRAFMDSLAGAVTTEYQQRLNTLNVWYQGQFKEDPSLLAGVDCSFTDFIQRLQAANPDGDFSAEPVRQLVYRYWQSLDKDDSGRTAMLVEGPAGWGKDFVLGRTIRLWQKQERKQRPVRPFVHINANPNQWSNLAESVKQAMSQGQLIAISELNLIPSHYAEGLLNDVLTGHAAPGFRLFATINPGYFVGREALSKALTSRCTQIRLAALDPEDLARLVQGLPEIPDGLPQWLAGHFHQLSTALHQQNCPVQLSLDDLFSSARHLASQRPEQWYQALQKHLSLPFRALQTLLPPLLEDAARLERIKQEEQRRRALEASANSMPGLLTPITVTFGPVPRCHDREITVTPEATAQNVMTIVHAMQQGPEISRKSGSTVKRKKTSHLAYPSAFGDIVAPRHYKVTRYFPKHPYDACQYRLSFLQTRLDEDGQLRNYPIDWTNGTITSVAGWPGDLVWRTDLEADELPGKFTLILNNQWQPLPALTSKDQLRALRCTPDTPIELARSELTGQLLIKSKASSASPVTVDFIIARGQTYFTRLRPGDRLTLPEGLCSQRLADLLAEKIFYSGTNTCEAYAELHDIDGILDIPQRLNALMGWLDTFSDSKNVTGQDEQLLLNMLREKQGVCRHKAMIFQVLCHYWGIPARQVENASHRFVEISPDGGHTWRQYQLGGGGRATADITEPDWGEYRQPDFSKLKLPTKSGYSDQLIDSPGVSLKLKIDYCLSHLTCELQQNQNGSVSTELMHKFKDIYSEFHREPLGSSLDKDLPNNWGILLSPQMFYRFGENIQDWEHIIEKSAWYMADVKGNIGTKKFLITQCLPELCHLLHTQKPDVHYLNWLCDLYRSAPQFLKYALLAILQTFSGSCDSCQLKDRVKLLLGTYPLSPLKTDFDASKQQGIHIVRCSERCLKFIKTMTMSRSLLQRLSQPRVHQQLHYQPVGNSIIIPEKLMSGEAAFLNVSKSISYKPIIFNCTFLPKEEVDKKIEERIKSGIRSEIREIYESEKDFVTLNNIVKQIFLCWLAAHHIHHATPPIWLAMFYDYYAETMQPIQPIQEFFLTDGDDGVDPMLQLKLPPESIKGYFNQPSAVVLQTDDLLVLLDEFLTLIAD
ncbi:AAA family ATPase [Thalassotalea sp. G20_0]|uniref:AAA family ATPase n=1 Tax=Thalassotalea sp. G20_0 TaxID=2821093 RepID=UPI001ADC4F88|nr:AAA family ATPase [Thalassotalea sp. G20_0]MBO9495906.1 AAA family ATPase [Thalassotalea sp. G20_0]